MSHYHSSNSAVIPQYYPFKYNPSLLQLLQTKQLVILLGRGNTVNATTSFLKGPKNCPWCCTPTFPSQPTSPRNKLPGHYHFPVPGKFCVKIKYRIFCISIWKKNTLLSVTRAGVQKPLHKMQICFAVEKFMSTNFWSD